MAHVVFVVYTVHMIQVIDAHVSVLAIQEATADAKLMFKIFLETPYATATVCTS